jgi:hypothetical protein
MQPVPPPPEIVITAPALAEPAAERLLGVSRITREAAEVLLTARAPWRALST